MLEGNLATIGVQVHTIIGRSITVCRQRVVGTTGIVASTLTSIRTQEYATRIHHALSQLLIVLYLQNQVLRGIGIREGNHLVNGIDEHVIAVFKGFSGHLLTGQLLQLALHFGLHLVQLRFTGGDEEHLRVDAVFSLRQQVGRYKLSVGRIVSQYAHLRRTSRHIDGHLVKTDLLLGSHHILIARTEYLEDLGHTLRTVSHSANGLNATRLEYLAYSGNACSHQNGRIHLAFLVRRRTQHDLLATSYLGRCCQHQHRRKEWGSASRNVETHLFDGYALLPANHTLLGLYLLTHETL